MSIERDSTHHAAHRMTMKMARSVARLPMIMTNRKISRCNVVIDDDSAEESFAIRPLEVSWIRSETLMLRDEMGIDTYKTVLSPIWKTRPRPDPLTQSVP